VGSSQKNTSESHGDDFQSIEVLRREMAALEERVTHLERTVSDQGEVLKKTALLLLVYVSVLAVIIGKIFFSLL